MNRLLFLFFLFFISSKTFAQYCESETYIVIYNPFHYNSDNGKNCIIYDDSLFTHKEHDSLLVPISKVPIDLIKTLVPDTLGVPPNDSVVFYYPGTKFPYYIISNKENKTKITFYDLFSNDRSSILLNNEDFSYEKVRLVFDLPPYPEYDEYILKKTRNAFLTKKRCFSTEANDSCISIHVRDFHKQVQSYYNVDTNYYYYLVTVEVKNNCDIDRANYCLNIARFHQNQCTWADNFLTNNINKYQVIYDWRDCPSNLGGMHSLKPGEKIAYDSLRVWVRKDACVNNIKCRIGFVYMTDDLRKKYNLTTKEYIKYSENNEGIIWSDEFCFE